MEIIHGSMVIIFYIIEKIPFLSRKTDIFLLGICEIYGKRIRIDELNASTIQKKEDFRGGEVSKALRRQEGTKTGHV